MQWPEVSRLNKQLQFESKKKQAIIDNLRQKLHMRDKQIAELKMQLGQV